MLTIPRPRAQAPTSIYEKLGLRDLAFPTGAVVNPYSDDPRINGTIFAENPVRAEIDKFERLLVRPQDFTNRAKFGYLWSKGDRESGRGMGKTALLRYFRQRINRDWGYTEFNGGFSACVVYVSFPSQIDRRYMEQLSLSALVDICESDLLDAARAYLRLQLVPQDKANEIMRVDGEEPQPQRILDDSILAANDIAVAALNSEIVVLEPPFGQCSGHGTFDTGSSQVRKEIRLAAGQDNSIIGIHLPCENLRNGDSMCL